MHIVELIEIALANIESGRVEVAALEPADVAMEAVSGLAQIVSELVDNAIAFSEPGDKARITGLFDQEGYLISISDRGVGLSDDLISELNSLLDDPYVTSGPEPRLGIALVARLAARHGIKVKLVPGVPGTTARVTMPGQLATVAVDEGARASGEHRLPPRQGLAESAAGIDQVFASSVNVENRIDPSRFERGPRPGSGVVAMSEEARREAEAFLERVFGPLIDGPGVRRREPSPNGIETESERDRLAPDWSDTGGTVTALRTRVPGENFSLIADDPSTIAAERAIDIRTALSRFEQGRRAAEERENS